MTAEQLQTIKEQLSQTLLMFGRKSGKKAYFIDSINALLESAEQHIHLQNEHARLIEKSSELARNHEIMKEALDYYSNPVNHYRMDRYDESPVMVDRGSVARQTLREVSLGTS